MKAVIQRVSHASVQVSNKLVSEINTGLLIFLGITHDDDNNDVEWLATKIASLRIFNDKDGTMNLSVNDINGGVLVVSQFTLHAKTKKGNRPSYINAAKPEQANALYENFKNAMALLIKAPIGSGIFGADMKVQLNNDGPVTIIIDTKNKE
ncbi:MAG: D-aminoacyl-tRNA deacylase [Flavobacteriaceae bacterium]